MKFRLFGIPVTVDLFFFIGLVMIWSWAGGDRSGVFAAVFVGVFTLVHELGHALTARHYGARTAITLNLLVGWASYATPQPLTRRQRNLISLAGPLTQVVVCLPVLLLTYLSLPKAGSVEAARIVLDEGSMSFDMWRGAIWAGIIIGLLNLLPLWPLDGGHVVDSFLGRVFGDRKGRRVMLIGTLVVVGIIGILGVASQNPTAPFNGLEREVVDAQLAPYAPLIGTTTSFPSAVWEQVRHFPGNVLDFPFLLLIFCGINSFMALQRPRPARQPQVGLALMRQLATSGSAEQIADYGVALYEATHDAEVLYLTAAGLGRTGNGDDAMAWLRRAVQDRPDRHRLATDPAFGPLRHRPDFQGLLRSL